VTRDDGGFIHCHSRAGAEGTTIRTVGAMRVDASEMEDGD